MYTKEELEELYQLWLKYRNKKLIVKKDGLYYLGRLIHKFKYYGKIPHRFLKEYGEAS